MILNYIYINEGKAHLREALLKHEEAVASLKASGEFKYKTRFDMKLKTQIQKYISIYENFEHEDDFQVSWKLITATI